MSHSIERRDVVSPDSAKLAGANLNDIKPKTKTKKMNALEVVQNLQGKAGQHVKAVWVRPVKTLKGVTNLIMKRTEAYVRSGIAYANLASVRNAIESGKREPVQGLPWGQWRTGYANYIIDNKGKEYVRLYPASFDNLSNQATEWMIDGKPTTFEAVKPLLLASERADHEQEKHPACFTVNVENLVSIGD